MIRSAAAMERRKAYQRQYRRDNRDPDYDHSAHYHLYARAQRHANLRKRYGLSAERYESILLAQHGRCLICEDFMIDSVSRGGRKTGRSVAVDHDHATGEVRGLLCAKCNTGIAMLGENSKTLERASRYLKSWERLQAGIQK